jgi:membrane protein DedA with SNARE-associated domain
MFDAIRLHFVQMLHSLGGWSYLLVAFSVMLEGPIATILASAAACAGLLSPVAVFFACAIGNLCGDLCWYTMGRLVPLRLLLRVGPWIGLREAALPYIRAHVNQNSRRLMFTAKLTWVFATTALMSLGISRVPITRWFPVNMAAECIWTGTLVATGVKLVAFISTLQHWLQVATIVGYVAFFFFVLFYIRTHRPHWESAAPEDLAVAA